MSIRSRLPCRRSNGGLAPGTLVQRQSKGKPPPKVVDPVAPNERQQDMIDKARRAAAIRSQGALFKVRGLHPHTGTQDRPEVRRLARIKFNWLNPNMDQIDEVVVGCSTDMVTNWVVLIS